MAKRQFKQPDGAAVIRNPRREGLRSLVDGTATVKGGGAPAADPEEDFYPADDEGDGEAGTGPTQLEETTRSAPPQPPNGLVASQLFGGQPKPFTARGTRQETQTAASRPMVALAKLGEEHLDNLWDWIRQDEDRGFNFLGVRCSTYAQMVGAVNRFLRGMFALMDGDTHIGILILDPIGDIRESHICWLHVYLNPAARGHLPELVPTLQTLANQELPGVSFCIATLDESAARLYARFGFKLKYMLEWTPPKV